MATRSSPAKKNGALDPALPQKKRARRRLVGAAALCLLAAVALPVLFDSEPRQVRGDVQVRIPARDTPLTESSDTPAVPAPLPSLAASEAGGVASERTPSDAPGPVEAPKPDVPVRTVPSGPGDDVRAYVKPEPKAAPKKTPANPTDGAPRNDSKASGKTEARPEAKPPARPEPDPIGKLVENKAGSAKPAGSYLLQAGAFSSEKAATEQAERLRQAGVAVYVEKIKANGGERSRVRVGPFANRDAAERARAKLKAAGIDAALIAP